MRSKFVVVAGLVLPMWVSAQTVPQNSQEQRIQLLERRIGALSDIMLRLDRLQNEVQQLRGEIELQAHAMDALKKRQRDLYLDVDQRLGELAQPGLQSAGTLSTGGTAPVEPTAGTQTPHPGTAPTVTSPTVVAAPPVSPAPATGGGDPAEEAARYQSAFDLLMQRRYAEARDAFSDFLASYPGGQYADNAQYWLAEASYVTRDFGRAEAEFARVINEYPESAKVPDAMLKTGFIQYEQQQWKAARDTLNKLVENYPVSTAARLARKRLERMAAEGR